MKLLWTGCVLLLCATSSVFGDETSKPAGTLTAADSTDVQWLEQRSMLHQAQALAQHIAGDSAQWQHPYGVPQPRAASSKASVWFTAYPASTVASAPGASVLSTLADERLWSAFQAIGIQAIHTGPMKRSGGINGHDYTPSVDGNFDRISFDIDPNFGTEEQYKRLVQSAGTHGAVVIGDVIPGHTGKGADFLLAERAYGDYPGLYHMVRIEPSDWGLLPPVPGGHDSVNLSPAIVDALQAKHYIVGMLSSKIFYAPGVKDSDWSATDVVRGTDGVSRRWVYLHYFKQGQPTLNWLDPTFAAQRLVIGDAIHELTVLGDGGVRLDANGLLGIERDPKSPTVWSEGHPLSDTSNQLIADMVRKMGGFTFQELALAFDKVHEMSNGGADLTYDFVTRPAYEHALLTGDAEFLRIIFQLMRQNEIDSAGLIHALQNHDELTMGLSQFTGPHENDHYSFRGAEVTGKQLRAMVHEDMYSRLIGTNAPYNLKFGDGVASTTATIITASLGIKDISKLTRADIERIKRVHLLLAFYNAFQPGVFALSGWDLVGALTLPGAVVKDRLADGDTRWINRGAYDLIGSNPKARASAAGLPVTVALYGPLPKQLTKPDSFASKLAHMLKVRADLHLYAGRLVDAPAVQAKGLFVLVHQLPDSADLEVTAINFGSTSVNEAVAIRKATQNSTVTDVLDAKAPASTINADGALQVSLGAYEGKALRIAGH
ncbi:MAG TPA: maltose alpha-D-glucosyltransferase [Steroidobacteraceae bacterium]|nr:maltose alpha-D-glucosyltransferase [Steroidobacteraceae bacterium]